MDLELFHSDRFTRIIYFPLVIIYIYFLSFQKPGINSELYFSRVCRSLATCAGQIALKAIKGCIHLLNLIIFSGDRGQGTDFVCNEVCNK